MIIAFSGRMKSGKDTAADFLVELRGFHRMAFADNLKKMCMHVFGLTEYQCYTQKGKERKLVAPIKATTNSVHEVAVWCIQENFWKKSTFALFLKKDFALFVKLAFISGFAIAIFLASSRFPEIIA